jgi:DNA-binding transcriptional regulator YiaG
MSNLASTGGTVTSLASHPAYRPDFRSMASDQVRAAREKLHLDHNGFATYLTEMVGWGVMPGVVAKWEAGSGVPPGDVLLAATAAAQDGPSLDRDPREAVATYAGRGLITRQQWNDIIRDSREHLWLYGMAELGYAEDDETPGIVADAAAAGCAIRVLLLDPAHGGIPGIDAAEGSPAGTLAARIGSAMARFTRMRQACGGAMEVRAYDAHPTVSVIRGDNDMLITPYLRYFAGNNSPTLGITAASAPRMFGRYARHFAGMWELARECA